MNLFVGLRCGLVIEQTKQTNNPAYKKVISRRFLFLAVLSFVGSGWLSGQVGSIEAMKPITLFPTPNLCSCPLRAGHLPTQLLQEALLTSLYLLGSVEFRKWPALLCCILEYNRVLSSLSAQQRLTFKQTFLLGWFSCGPWISFVFFYCLQQSRLQLCFLCFLNDWNGLKIILWLRLRM